MPHHTFKHEAMLSPWQILISAEDPTYAAQAAAAAFAEVDLIEGTLSRFIDTSDAARINAAPAGTTVRVGEHAIECLKTAARLSDATGGVFDVTIGPLIRVWRNPDKSPRTPSPEDLAAARARVGMNLLEIDQTAMTVRTKVDGVNVDLGGIGKGYGADRAADVLRDWGIQRALVSAGTSTVLAIDAPEGEEGWPIAVGGVGAEPEAPYTLALRNGSLSGSGVYAKGSHIIDPHTGKPVENRLAAWSLATTGAEADALSTAFMIMTPEKIQAYTTAHTDTSAMIAEKQYNQIRRQKFGPWPGLKDTV
ncbi:MAG TPA: FAD:protein FMN transferase [Candidatus Bathyarchaeia archaeon]|nr:FAD:protein FMN transferase [Candidatus Bathyarchaeia archaeon]